MNFAQQLATDLSNVVAGGKPQRAKAKPAKADDTIKLGKRPLGTLATAKAKPAKAASKPAKAAPAAKAAPSASATRYALGKPFVAKASGKYAQAENWAVVAGLLAKSPATREELITALKAAAEKGGYMDRENAVGFVGGRIRGGHIVVAE